MPRFQLSSYEDAPSSLLVNRQRGGSSYNTSSSSCRLVTHDGRSVHSLVSGRCIESRRLPLESSSSSDDERFYDSNQTDLPALIRTELPPSIQSALEIDPAVELVCVEGENRRRNHRDGQQQLLPRLLLYTRKSAFLLQIVYSVDDDVDEVQGEVLSVEEPLERFFEVSTETSILRIRPAPQCSAGYATLSPAACFAALTENRETCEYSLLLHHGDGSVTTPLLFGVEDVFVEGERFTDFCFAQSNGLSLFPSLSILLLKGSGDVLAASPVVFDGTVIAKSVIEEGHNYLQEQLLDRCSDRDSAKWRQGKAAAQFLMDVFGHSENRGHYSTACVLYQADKSAAKWPIKLQGPILFHSALEPGPLSAAIENFGSSDCLVGVAIGKVAGKVDFAALSPTSLLPRFAFESCNDALDLDDALFKFGAFVERIDLCPDGGSAKEPSSVSIVKDPVVDTLLHYATPAAVYTVSTTAMRAASRKVKGQSADPVRTTAWACLNSADAVQGVVVPSDAAQGHVLVAGLKSGSMVPIDVTESKYLHEFDSLFQSSSSPGDRLLLEDDPANSAIPPLYDEVKPLITKINAGLSKMNRIVGSETSCKSISPDFLAVALQIKKRCDDEVALPLLELKKLVEKHRADLTSRLEQQREQVQSGIESVKDLQRRMSAMGERMETVETNATILSQRSLAVVQTSQRLLPTITQAEYDYFQAIKRLNLKCTQMEREVKQLNEEVTPRCDALDESTVSEAVKNLDEESIKRANALLRYESEVLRKIRERFAKTEELTQQLAREHGIAT